MKLPTPDATPPAPRFAPAGAFHEDLLARVEAYFRSTGKSRRGGPRMALKTVTLLGWLAGSWALLMFGGFGTIPVVLLTISLGLAMAGVGFGVMHDANHGGYSASSRVNRLMGLSMELLGGSSHLWKLQHNVQHHNLTNVAGHDPDIDSGRLLRMAPWQERRGFHRFQHLYIWGLYAVFPLRWWLLDDYRELVTGRVGERSFPPPRGATLAQALLGKAVFYTWAFVLPAILHPTLWLVPLWLLGSFTLGTALAGVFQLAHTVERAAFLDGATSGDWATHQVATTVNFANGNRLLSWYLGGLNHQVEHHLFPAVCHLHYPALAPIVEATCNDHGLRYRSEPTLVAAVASNQRWLKRMGRAQQPALQP